MKLDRSLGVGRICGQRRTCAADLYEGARRDRAAGCVIVLAKSGRLELGEGILRTL